LSSQTAVAADELFGELDQLGGRGSWDAGRQRACARAYEARLFEPRLEAGSSRRRACASDALDAAS
jgi:hypothetical protein